MPYLTNSTPISELFREVRNVMLYPDDEEKRLNLTQSIDRCTQEERYLDYEFIRYDLYTKLIGPGIQAGSLLLSTLFTDKKITSLRLSKEALSQTHYGLKATSKVSLEKTWKYFHPVVHFWAAECLFNDSGVIEAFQLMPGFPCAHHNLMLFLSIAEALRIKAESFKVSRSPVPLLDQNLTWKVPSSVHLDLGILDNFGFTENHPVIIQALEHRKT